MRLDKCYILKIMANDGWYSRWAGMATASDLWSLTRYAPNTSSIRICLQRFIFLLTLSEETYHECENANSYDRR